MKFIALSVPELNEVINKIFKIKEARLFTGSDADTFIKLMNIMQEKDNIHKIPLMIELLINLAHTKNFIEAGKRELISKQNMRMDIIRSYCASYYMKK